jgi:hypothetical protein
VGPKPEAWLQVNTLERTFCIPNQCNEPIFKQLNFIILHGKYFIYRYENTLFHLHYYKFLLEFPKQVQIKHETMASAGTVLNKQLTPR